MQDNNEAGASPASPRFHIYGEYLMQQVDGCTCAPFEGAHEPYCGFEPALELTKLPALFEAITAAQVGKIAEDLERVLGITASGIAPRSARILVTEAASRLSLLAYQIQASR